MSSFKFVRYSRQMKLHQIGEKGQKKICESLAYIEGSGLKSWVHGRYLAGAGVLRIAFSGISAPFVTSLNPHVEPVEPTIFAIIHPTLSKQTAGLPDREVVDEGNESKLSQPGSSDLPPWALDLREELLKLDEGANKVASGALEALVHIYMCLDR